MVDQVEAVAGGDFKDRKTGLVVFGILGIVAGGFCALIIPFMVFGMMMSHSASQENATVPMPPGAMISSVAVYLMAAVWFIWMGIGSIKARRWAMALILVSSWLWLIAGICGFVFMALFMPNPYTNMPKNSQVPEDMGSIIRVVTLGFMLVLYVIVPGVLVLFYGSRHVKMTCEHRDPQVRWTDKCPLPVLAVSLAFAAGACSIPFIGFYCWALPFFGTIVTGAAGAAIALACMVLYGYLAWGTYHLKTHAWWATLLLTISWGASAGITFARVSLMDYYAKMNYAPQQIEMMRAFVPPQSSLLVSAGLWLIVVVSYLIYIRKYFAHAANAKPAI
jgi:hypothetical protein